MEIDFGALIGGWIVDYTWTVEFNPSYDPLLEAVRGATEISIENSGTGAQLCRWQSSSIDE